MGLEIARTNRDMRPSKVTAPTIEVVGNRLFFTFGSGNEYHVKVHDNSRQVLIGTCLGETIYPNEHDRLVEMVLPVRYSLSNRNATVADAGLCDLELELVFGELQKHRGAQLVSTMKEYDQVGKQSEIRRAIYVTSPILRHPYLGQSFGDLTRGDGFDKTRGTTIHSKKGVFAEIPDVLYDYDTTPDTRRIFNGVRLQSGSL